MNTLWSTFLRTVTSITCQILRRRIWKWIAAINEYWDFLILCSDWSCCCSRLIHVTNIREYNLDTDDHLFIVTIIIIIIIFAMPQAAESLPTGDLWLIWCLWVILSRVCWARSKAKCREATFQRLRAESSQPNGYSWISLLVWIL